MKKTTIVAAFCAAAGASTAFGSAFTSGNLVVLRVGDGAAALSSAAQVASLQEMTTAGSNVQLIGMPTVAAGANRRFTIGGTANSEGQLSLSSNGQYLTLGGYDAAVGTAAVNGTTSVSVPRVVARVDLNGNIDTTTAITDTLSGVAIRGTASFDGSGFWVAGAGSSTGVRYIPIGGAATTQVAANPGNGRTLNIFNGQLFAGAATAGFSGISTVGSGLPTGTGNASVLTVAQLSTYDFWFADSNTLYIADDSATVGGLNKYTFNGSSWTLAYRITLGLSGSFLRQLCGTTDGSGNFVIYATTTETSQNKVVTLTDTGSGSAFSVISTAPQFTVYRGIDFVPVPAPGTLALLGLAGLAVRRRR